jgi:hypothetical protein
MRPRRGRKLRKRDEEGIKKELRSLRSLQDGNENRGELFAFLSQRCEFFRADSPGFYEQFQPVGALTRYFPSSSPRYLAGFTIYVAVTQNAPFFDLAKRIAAFRNELIRSLTTRALLPSRVYRLCRFTPVAPFSFASRAKRFSIIGTD